jgi:hypothetical protein
MTDEPSSEPKWVTIKDGSDRVWKQISMYELKQLEYAINEDEPGHLKELHDSGNNIIDRVRSRTVSSQQPEKCLYWGSKDGKNCCAFLIPEPDLYVELTEHLRAEGRDSALDDFVLWNDTREIFHLVQDYKRHLRQKGRKQ